MRGCSSAVLFLRVETLGTQGKVESMFEGVAGNAPEALGEAFGIAMIAARTDLDAAGNRIPGCIRPFDR